MEPEKEFTHQVQDNFNELIKLQRESNKRLKDIDTTLDWFFWIMIIGIVGTVITFFFTAMALV